MGARRYQMYCECCEDDISRVRQRTSENIMFITRDKSGIFKHPCIFSVYYINYSLYTNIKYPEAMIDDYLKSDHFHVKLS